MLLRTWLVLCERSSLAIPADIRPLVESVYGSGSLSRGNPHIESALQQFRAKLDASQAKERAEAEIRYLPPPDGEFSLEMLTDMGREDDEEAHPFFRALTRLAEKSVSAVCLYGSETAAFLDRDRQSPATLARTPSPQEALKLLRRAVTISDRRIVDQIEEQRVPAAWKRSPWLRHSYPLYFEDDLCPVGRCRVRLSPDLGLSVEEVSDEV